MIKSTLSILIISSLLLFTACSGNENNIPTINTNFSNFSLLENSGINSYRININDVDGDKLTLSIESNNTNILTVTKNFTNPLVQANYNGQTLSFNLTTVQNASGIVRITITVDDSDKNSTKSFDINVVKTFKSGDKWKGFEYKTITSQETNRVWLDRNLGASRVCITFDDSACFGDYYQWGRNTDGHEKSNSNTTPTKATSTSNVGHGKFITSTSAYNGDWVKNADKNGSTRSANWNPCPLGYRLPTIDELLAENIKNRDDAFNKLKLPSAGYRSYLIGSLRFKVFYGDLWSSSINGSYSNDFGFGLGGANSGFNNRANGYSIRCMRDYSPR